MPNRPTDGSSAEDQLDLSVDTLTDGERKAMARARELYSEYGLPDTTRDCFDPYPGCSCSCSEDAN